MQQNEHPLILRARRFSMRIQSMPVSVDRSVIWIGVCAFVVILGLIGAWKLWSFGYNGLDLAIYRQVAAHSIHGDFFGFTIHPHSYLGDHFEPLFAALFPLYALIQHPMTLVLLQAFAITTAAIPIARIAERFVGRPWHLLFGIGYLMNPVVQNMALFEFHMLPFAIPIVSFAILAYLERRYWLYCACLAASLLVREDVSLVVIGFGVLALFDRKSIQWWLPPMLIGSAWFAVAMKLTSLFSGYGHYKFLIYYRWLGATVPDALQTVMTHPWMLISHLFSWSNIAFLVAVLLPFSYLPLFRPRWIIPVIPILLQLLLVQSPGELLLDIHYPSLLLPFFSVASAAAFAGILAPSPRGLLRRLAPHRAIVVMIFSLVTLYCMVVIGPLAQSVPVIAASPKIADRVHLERDIVRTLPEGGTVAGLETLTDLSDRDRLFSLHYVFLGTKQFSEKPYVVPDDASVMLFDLRDALMYQLLYKQSEQGTSGGYARLRKFLRDREFAPTFMTDRFIVYERSPSASIPPITSTRIPPKLSGLKSTHGSIDFLGWSTPDGTLREQQVTVANHEYTILPVSLTFIKRQQDISIDQIEFSFQINGKLQYSTLLPFGGGIFPTSDWVVGEPVTQRYVLLVPSSLPADGLTITARVMDLNGEVGLNGVRSLILRYTKYQAIGPLIDLGPIQSAATTR